MNSTQELPASPTAIVLLSEADRRWNRMTIQNRYLFAHVMRVPDICRRFLQITLPDLSIGQLIYTKDEEMLEGAMDSRSVRLDVYTEDEKDVYDIEMQVVNEGNLPRRSRYYGSMLDEVALSRGEEYNALRDSFVIFLCPSDPFRMGRRIYTFRNACVEDPALPLEDGAWKIFLYTKGTIGDVTPELQAFMDYVNSGIATDAFTNRVDDQLQSAKANKDLRRQIMRWEDELRHEKYIAREEGLKEGREEGRLDAIFSLFKDGIITAEIASSQTGLPIEEIQNQVQRPVDASLSMTVE